MTSWTLTLKNLWPTSMRILIVYHAQTFNMPEYWSGFAMLSPWTNTNDANVLVEFLEKSYITKQRPVYG